ncbi:MAG: adenylosuccinate lyase [Gammaproteobacteria bacterium]
MSLTPLTAISPVDGRYHHLTQPLSEHFSEYALMHYRIHVEVQWVLFLSQQRKIKELPKLSREAEEKLVNIATYFSHQDSVTVKEIEKTTNHDVKAIEYFIKQNLSQHAELNTIKEFVHFGCTSEDINNLSYALMLKDARDQHIVPALEEILAFLRDAAHEYASQPMLARTHGQTASPTTVGKEFANVAARLQRQIEQIKDVPVYGKLNSATGNFNAFVTAYPELDWPKLTKTFIESLGLVYNPYTTQIEPHDFIAELSHAIARANTILIDFARDIWGYISLNYFKQKLKAGEVGSSTMPHKVNPIDFENAEGNLGIANALFNHFAEKLPISRWQRDLSDSTVLRALGNAFAHSLIAYKSLDKGCHKLELNQPVVDGDLAQRFEILAEGIQTVMRRYGIDEPYEKLKQLTRGKSVTEENIQQFIENLDLPEDVKQQLKGLTPGKYIGLASILAKEID